MTKGELMEIVFEGDSNGVDTAVPQSWSDKIRELGIDPAPFVWSYKKNKIWGEPVNLLEEYAKIIIRKTSEII
jgi:hypothetical protein